MNKLRAIIVLVIMSLAITPGYADTDSFKKFMKEVKKQQSVSGRPQAVVEGASFIIFMFGIEKTMKKFKFDKIKDTYEIKEMNMFDPPGALHQEPAERLKEAIEVYGTKAA